MDAIQQQIEDKGLNAPRVRPEDLEAEIDSEWYFTAADGAHSRFCDCKGDNPWGTPLERLTFCVLLLRNGFTVTGESACVSPENFDAGIGRQIARQNAVNKLWPLLGFRLADRVAQPVAISSDAQWSPAELEAMAARGPGEVYNPPRIPGHNPVA